MKAPDITSQVKLSDSANTSPSFNSVKMRKRPSKNSLPHVTHSSRSSLHMFPIISGLVDKQNLEIGLYLCLFFICLIFLKNKINVNCFVFQPFSTQSMEHCGMDHCNLATAQILRLISLGHQLRKKIYILGWQNNTKKGKNMSTKEMLKTLS